MNTIYLAGGCFWGMQKFIDQFDGVTETEVGYANGPDQAPSYQDVCSNSGHAETVRIAYDPARISLKELLEYYFLVIDPLSVNRQGGDCGIRLPGSGEKGWRKARRGAAAAAQLLPGRGVPSEVSGQEPGRILPYPNPLFPPGIETARAKPSRLLLTV